MGSEAKFSIDAGFCLPRDPCTDATRLARVASFVRCQPPIRTPSSIVSSTFSQGHTFGCPEKTRKGCSGEGCNARGCCKRLGAEQQKQRAGIPSGGCKRRGVKQQKQRAGIPSECCNSSWVGTTVDDAQNERKSRGTKLRD